MREVLKFAKESNVEIAAVCDIWKQAREQAAAMIEKVSGKEPKQVKTMRTCWR